jgi:hypothetical protein
MKINIGDLLVWYGNEISMSYVTNITIKETITGPIRTVRIHTIRRMNVKESESTGKPVTIYEYDYEYEYKHLKKLIKSGSMLHYKSIREE